MPSDASADVLLESMFEAEGLPRYELPGALATSYGGSIGFPEQRVLANFVTSVDGVVALSDAAESGHIISKGSVADRFVMGLLRACADTVIVGASTFRKGRGHLWRAETIFPDGAAAFVELRARLGLKPVPKFVVVTRSGNIDTAEPALEGALIVTTRSAEATLKSRVSRATEVVALGVDALRLGDVIGHLRRRAARVILTEGGPTVFAELVRDRLVDELFVTVSPALFGRFGNDRRKSLADGVDLGGSGLELLSAKRKESYLFLRYALAAEPSASRSVTP